MNFKTKLLHSKRRDRRMYKIINNRIVGLIGDSVEWDSNCF